LSSCLTAYGKNKDYPSNYDATYIPCNTQDQASQWNYDSSSHNFVNAKLNQCLDVEKQSTANNTDIFVYDCNGGSNQKWTQNANGTIITQLDNQCLTVNINEPIDSSLTYYAQICGRMSSNTRGLPPVAYCLLIDVGSQKYLIRANTASIASGSLPFVVNFSEWHKFSLTFQGSTITATLDGTRLNSIQDTTYGYGMVAVGSGWHEAFIDDFSITPL